MMTSVERISHVSSEEILYCQQFRGPNRVDYLRNSTETEAIEALQAGLNTLVQNKSLAEQFVRDVKSSADPTDPAYEQVMETYEDARDSYNNFLDGLEFAAKTNQSQTNLTEAAETAQTATADFLEGATRTLRPNADTRGIAFRRAIILPDALARNLKKLPKKSRQDIVNRFDREVRWRSWRQL